MGLARPRRGLLTRPVTRDILSAVLSWLGLTLILVLLLASFAFAAWRRARLRRLAAPADRAPEIAPEPTPPPDAPTLAPSPESATVVIPPEPPPEAFQEPSPEPSPVLPAETSVESQSPPSQKPEHHRSMTALRRRKPPPPPYPIVLAHGIFGFDTLGVGNLRQEYFRGIAGALRTQGTEVYVIRVSPVGSIADRAAQLAQQIRLLKARRVNIVAHSMGGLDARYALSRLSLSRCVASLTTIGTPHFGTPIADGGLRLAADRLGLRRMIEALGARAFDDLTTAKMAAFNEQTPNAPEVVYASYLGAVTGGPRRVNVLLIPGYLYLKKLAGGNDGIVPAASQKWGDVMGEVQADHWAQIGWSTNFDARSLYERIVAGLRARGL